MKKCYECAYNNDDAAEKCESCNADLNKKEFKPLHGEIVENKNFSIVDTLQIWSWLNLISGIIGGMIYFSMTSTFENYTIANYKNILGIVCISSGIVAYLIFMSIAEIIKLLIEIKNKNA
jgi:hypothetical protein